MLRKAIVPLLLLLALPVRVPAQADAEVAIEPEVMVVTGRLPGPTMWRVVNGDNVLWIFPSFAPVPKRMEWDSTLVRGVLADAGVYLTQPASRLSLMNSLAPEAARDCFELELRRIEIDLDAIKHRANEWANGRIGEFRAVQLRTGDNPCGEIFFTSSESETMQELARQSQEKWLAGAEDALTNHLTSFAVLDIVELLNEDGLLSRLAEKGYSVRAPN
jgi:hypothetical protein